MESQWGYNLQCNVIDNLLINECCLFTTIPLQYDPKQKEMSRNGEFTSSSVGGGDQRTDPS